MVVIRPVVEGVGAVNQPIAIRDATRVAGRRRGWRSWDQRNIARWHWGLLETVIEKCTAARLSSTYRIRFFGGSDIDCLLRARRYTATFPTGEEAWDRVLPRRSHVRWMCGGRRG